MADLGFMEHFTEILGEVGVKTYKDLSNEERTYTIEKERRKSNKRTYRELKKAKEESKVNGEIPEAYSPKAAEQQLRGSFAEKHIKA